MRENVKTYTLEQIAAVMVMQQADLSSAEVRMAFTTVLSILYAKYEILPELVNELNTAGPSLQELLLYIREVSTDAAKAEVAVLLGEL